MYDSTISRNEGWNFGKLGQVLERADKTSRVLDAKYHHLLESPKQVGSSLDLIQWAALLKSVSALICIERNTESYPLRVLQNS
jgi:uncharacterized alpha-E superfamily protein